MLCPPGASGWACAQESAHLSIKRALNTGLQEQGRAEATLFCGVGLGAAGLAGATLGGLGLHGAAVDDADVADDVLDGLGRGALASNVWGVHLQETRSVGVSGLLPPTHPRVAWGCPLSCL